MSTTVDDLVLMSLKGYYDRGILVPITSSKEVPFIIKRIFYVTQHTGWRGGHAHKICSQLLTCLGGVIQVVVSDGKDKREVSLDSPTKGLYIPKGLWAEQYYSDSRDILLVICDHDYDTNEYIRDPDEFRKWKKINEA